MAAKTPDAYNTVFDPDTYIPVNAAAGVAPTATGAIAKNELVHRVYRFDDVADGSTWPSGIPGIVHLATQKIGTEQLADARLTTAATGLVTFTVASGTPDFYLHVWSRG